MRFLLVCDGSADQYLVQHIRRLLIELGDGSPDGDAWYHGRRLSDRIRSGLEYSSSVDCLFIHRDAEHPSQVSNRRDEMVNALREAEYADLWVGIIPIRMTEAWLLLDESSIRRVSGSPNGTNELRVPRPRDVEGIVDPKSELNRMLTEASGARGRRRRRIQKELPRMRRQLLEDLAVSPDLTQVPAWQSFRVETLNILGAGNLS